MHDAFTLMEMSAKKGISEIDILGGEPMLVPWMKEFILDAIDSGIRINISTNGSIPDLIAEYSVIDADSLNIGFSILGLAGTHNRLTKSHNFSGAVEGIKTMISAGRDPIVKSVLMKENTNEIRALVFYLAELGVKRYYLLHEDTIGRRKGSFFSFPEYYEFYSMLKSEMAGILDIGSVAASGFRSGDVRHIPDSGRCDAGMRKMAIMPDGAVYPCNLFFGMREFKLGNIFRDSLEQILSNPLLDIFRNYKSKLCTNSDCAYFMTCRDGCPAHSYYFYGRFDCIDPRCSKKT